MPERDNVTFSDGSVNWSGGVDSVLVTTVQSDLNPNGIRRDQLCWLNNATVRDGGISPRDGLSLVGTLHDASGLFQGQFIYDPFNDNPYLIVAISGHIYKVVISPSFSITDLTANPALRMPASAPHFYFVQAEQFLVIQAGDNLTLPLFWDGTTLRRSKGITNTAVAPGTPGINEIPAATSMDYYEGRLWYSTFRVANAGDIVRGSSGTAAYNFTDSVLNVTECPLVVGGDGFAVPVQAGNIRVLFHNANLNAPLGQGTLFIGTRKEIFALNVPVSRAAWIATTNSNQPVVTVVQLVNGPVSDRSIAYVNGDVYYQSLEPGIRSLFASVRNFGQAGNIEISAQETRVLQFSNRALLSFGFGVVFNNRLLESQLPIQLPQGVIHQALVPLDFIPMSTFAASQQPIWEGMYEGLQFLQGSTGDYGGLERCFFSVVSEKDSSIQLWEMVQAAKFDADATDDSKRIQWQTEFPAFTWGDFFQLKRLVSAELSVDRLLGTVIFQMDYRPDGQTCWLPWHTWQACSAKNSAEDCANPITYPLTQLGECYKANMTLPKPPVTCDLCMTRPSDIGYQFQTRLTIKGFCRVRGTMLKVNKVDESLYHNLIC